MGRAIQESFAVNLAANADVEASNVRAGSETFAASKVVDDDDTSYWATDDGVQAARITLDLGEPTLFNRLLLQEPIRLGQRVSAFTVEAWVDAQWKQITDATTIGYKRILRFPSIEAEKVRISITGSKGCPALSNVGIYNAPLLLDAPTITRNQAGNITLTTQDVGPIFYYTVDGSEPTVNSQRYTGPFFADGKVRINAIACDPASQKVSLVAGKTFDFSKKNWKIVGVADGQADVILDGEPSTVWHQGKNEGGMPIDLVVDLGRAQRLCGFSYLPDQNRWSRGVIVSFQFYISLTGVAGTWWTKEHFRILKTTLWFN